MARHLMGRADLRSRVFSGMGTAVDEWRPRAVILHSRVLCRGRGVHSALRFVERHGRVTWGRPPRARLPCCYFRVSLRLFAASRSGAGRRATARSAGPMETKERAEVALRSIGDHHRHPGTSAGHECRRQNVNGLYPFGNHWRALGSHFSHRSGRQQRPGGQSVSAHTWRGHGGRRADGRVGESRYAHRQGRIAVAALTIARHRSGIDGRPAGCGSGLPGCHRRTSPDHRISPSGWPPTTCSLDCPMKCGGRLRPSAGWDRIPFRVPGKDVLQSGSVGLASYPLDDAPPRICCGMRTWPFIRPKRR